MKIIVKKDYESVSKAAYKYVKKLLKTNDEPILGLATGSTPLGLYKNMIDDNKKGKISFANVKTVNLDEYVGLDKKSDQSYVYFMNTNLFDQVDIDKKNTNLPNGVAKDPQKECDRYNKVLAKNKQDIQILGIGANGHIGFNEPGTAFDSVTHIVELKDKTRQDNARFFKSIDEVPTHAITMGISNIMNARQIIIIATGEGKADAVKAMISDAPSENCPASALQNHPNVIVVLDREAASKL